MTEALAALAAAAGTAIVGAAGSDLWQHIKTTVARLFGRSDPQAETVAARRLDETHTALTSAGDQLPQIRAVAVSAWTTRLADLLEDAPELAGEMQAIVDQVAGRGGSVSGSVWQSVVGHEHAQQAVQGHGVQTNVFGGGHVD